MTNNGPVSVIGHKCWNLTETETFSSFCNWQRIILFNLSLNKNFTEFLLPGCKWLRKSGNAEDVRGLVKDAADKTDGKTAEVKVQHLNALLAQIASYSPVYLHHTIIEDSINLEFIWTVIREYYSFQQSEVNFLELASFHLEAGERYAHYYHRILSHVRDNLLSKAGGMVHNNCVPVSNETISPTVERLVVLWWLKSIHSNLPAVVAKSYSHELQCKSLKDLQPTLLKNMDTLLAEANGLEDKINVQKLYNGPITNPSQSAFSKNKRYNKFSYSNNRTRNSGFNSRNISKSDTNNKIRFCILCKICKRDSRHALASCQYLPVEDRPDFMRLRQVLCNNDEFCDDNEFIDSIYDNSDSQIDDLYNNSFFTPDISNNNSVVNTNDVFDNSFVNTQSQNSSNINSVSVNRVASAHSPTFNAFLNNIIVNVTVDSGAESSLIRRSTALQAALTIHSTHHAANQITGSLKVLGEVFFSITRDSLSFSTTALVVPDLDCDILAGVPFLIDNAFVIDIPRSRFIVYDKHIIPFQHKNVKFGENSLKPHVRRFQCEVLKANNSDILLPGNCISLKVPDNFLNDDILAISPRQDSPNPDWPEPQLISHVNGEIKISNTTVFPISIRKHSHIANVLPIIEKPVSLSIPSVMVSKEKCKDYNVLSSITIDKSVPSDVVNTVKTLHNNFVDIFDSSIGCYNDASGLIRAKVVIGSVEPPASKSYLPAYNNETMDIMQSTFDNLEMEGVLARPEDLGIDVVYTSPSFLTKKPSGGYRLVTAFNNIAQFARAPPSRVVTVESIFSFLAQWSFFVQTDMTSQFYQLPMDNDSIKYLGTMSPFKGIRVYKRAAMGMPGSSEYLDTLMTRVLGHLFAEGIVMRIADNLYVGGNSYKTLLENWSRVLYCFRANNLRLKPSKTEFCPTKTEILGWIWESGMLSASPHKVNPLATCHPPNTVKGLRSWIGSYKYLKSCIPGYSSLLSSLENMVSGKETSARICWSDEQITCFRKAQSALNKVSSIHIPRHTDQLIIGNDAASISNSIGSILFIKRDNKFLIAGYFC